MRSACAAACAPGAPGGWYAIGALLALALGALGYMLGRRARAAALCLLPLLALSACAPSLQEVGHTLHWYRSQATGPRLGYLRVQVEIPEGGPAGDLARTAFEGQASKLLTACTAWSVGPDPLTIQAARAWTEGEKPGREVLSISGYVSCYQRSRHRRWLRRRNQRWRRRQRLLAALRGGLLLLLPQEPLRDRSPEEEMAAAILRLLLQAVARA